MPNWTYNTLTVTGPLNEVSRFYSIIDPNDDSDDIRILSRLLPMPPEYEHTISGSHPYTASDGMDWYTWQTKNWGVKWGDAETTISSIDDKIIATATEFRKQWSSSDLMKSEEIATFTLSYDSPWSYPDLGLQTISQKWKKLYFVNEAQFEGYDPEDPEAYETAEYGDMQTAFVPNEEEELSILDAVHANG